MLRGSGRNGWELSFTKLLELVCFIGLISGRTGYSNGVAWMICEIEMQKLVILMRGRHVPSVQWHNIDHAT